MWWNGPSWLAQRYVQVPTQPTTEELVSLSTLEAKAVVCNTATPVPPEWIELRFSSYHKLLCVTAWAFRATHNFLSKNHGTTKLTSPHLTSVELASAEHFLYTHSQQRAFSTDLIQLKSMSPRPLRKSSILLSLIVFLGKDGLLQVGGRLSNASLTPSQKHPIVFSGKDILSYMLFQYNHVVLGHCGPTLLLSRIQTTCHWRQTTCQVRLQKLCDMQESSSQDRDAVDGTATCFQGHTNTTVHHHRHRLCWPIHIKERTHQETGPGESIPGFIHLLCYESSAH